MFPISWQSNQDKACGSHYSFFKKNGLSNMLACYLVIACKYNSLSLWMSLFSSLWLLRHSKYVCLSCTSYRKSSLPRFWATPLLLRMWNPFPMIQFIYKCWKWSGTLDPTTFQMKIIRIWYRVRFETCRYTSLSRNKLWLVKNDRFLQGASFSLWVRPFPTQQLTLFPLIFSSIDKADRVNLGFIKPKTDWWRLITLSNNSILVG